MEIWKDVVGWEDRYQVSNKGRVRSKDWIGKNPCTGEDTLHKGRIMKLHKNKFGYIKVNLKDSRNNKNKMASVHRLVAEAFIDNKENKPEVDHINTNREDNRVENLRWTTSKENHNNVLTLINHSKASKGRRLSEEQKDIIRKCRYKKVHCIELNKTYDSYCIAEKELGLIRGSINCYIRKTAYKHGIPFNNIYLNFIKVGD